MPVRLKPGGFQVAFGNRAGDQSIGLLVGNHPHGLIDSLIGDRARRSGFYGAVFDAGVLR